MSEKRFIFDDLGYDGFEIYDKTQEYFDKDFSYPREDGLIAMGEEQICDVLNELSTENRQLMQKNKELFKDLLESQGSYVRLVCFVQRLGLEGDDLARFEEEIGVNDE